ncbi:MAG: hypothetical protein JNM66_25815 [Bryobacterales bacterium]|nr:hypothetical protein [Bryobacterales bacterium]
MRTIFGLCAAILAVGGFLLWKQMQLPTEAGAFTGAPKAEVAALIERPKDFLNKTVLIEGEVRHQCKAMGCFFFFSVGDKQLRVDLEQIAMNAPMREGRPARVEGRMIPYADGYQLMASAVEFQ